MSRFHRNLCALALVLATGCATAPPPSLARPPEPPAPGTEDLWVVYAQTVRTAQYPVKDHISTGLVPILETNPELRWNQGRVLMVTWSKRKNYEGKVGQPYKVPQGIDIWVTAAPHLQRACREWDLPVEALPLRISQSLGLPPPPAEGGDDSFVQMWVDPKTFFRPCPDPEITDQQCQVSLDGEPVNRNGACPWSTNQVSGAFVQVSDDHLLWMCNNWKSTYTGDPQTSYPWTALGYTFDWGDLLHPQGQSEFVVPPGTTVWIEGISTAAEYCKLPEPGEPNAL